MPRTSPHYKHKLIPKGKLNVPELAKLLNVPEIAIRDVAAGRTGPTHFLLAQAMIMAPWMVNCEFLNLFQAVLRDPDGEETPPLVVEEPAKSTEAPVVVAEAPKAPNRWATRKSDPEPSHSEADPFAWQAWEARRLWAKGKAHKAAVIRAEVEEALDTEPWTDESRAARVAALQGSKKAWR